MTAGRVSADVAHVEHPLIAVPMESEVLGVLAAVGRHPVDVVGALVPRWRDGPVIRLRHIRTANR